MEEDLQKKLKEAQERAIERNQTRDIEMFTTDSGYDATLTIKDQKKTLTLGDDGYISTFDITEEGPRFVSLEDYKGNVISSDIERVRQYMDEAVALFNDGKLEGSAAESSQENEQD